MHLYMDWNRHIKNTFTNTKLQICNSVFSSLGDFLLLNQTLLDFVNTEKKIQFKTGKNEKKKIWVEENNNQSMFMKWTIYVEINLIQKKLIHG